MFGKKRLFTIIALVTILALLPTTALAGTFTAGGVTVTYPDSYFDCSPEDYIGFTGITPGTRVHYIFYRYDATTNWMIPLGSGDLYADPTPPGLPFPYPQVTGTLTFVVEVFVYPASGGVYKWQEQWSVTCEPPPGGEGCTPGYWKNHLEDWPPTGFATTDTFFDVFGVDWFGFSYTLLNAINQGGGGINRAARHGTAALLNAAYPGMNYPYSVADVIDMVQSMMIDPLAQANEASCSIR